MSLKKYRERCNKQERLELLEEILYAQDSRPFSEAADILTMGETFKPKIRRKFIPGKGIIKYEDW